MLQMLEKGATHVGVATDHVIESFRNELWPDYKTGEGIEPALFAQFHPLEEALAAMGVVVWPMVELEADDALASAARIAARIAARREGLHLDRRQGSRAVRARRPGRADGPQGEQDPRRRGVRAESSACEPALIPDFLALVGDAADGYPGIAGIGAVTAARLLNRHGPIEAFPRTCSANSASSRCCSRISRRCGRMRRCSATWTSCAGAARPTPSPRGRERIEAPRLLERAQKVARALDEA